ncbi:hypothetical protein [Nonomuraea sp. NPDC052265]
MTRRLEWLRAHGTGAARQRRAFERRGDPIEAPDDLSHALNLIHADEGAH